MNSVAASPMLRRRVRDLAVMALLLAVAGPAAAQQRLAGQCPLIVRKDQQILQPRPIPPAPPLPAKLSALSDRSTRGPNHE